MIRRNLAALAAFIDARQNRPHDWSDNCCVRFVFGAVAAQFGAAPDPGADWHDQRTARRAIAKVGGIAARMDELYAPIDPATAKRGDIAGVADPVHGFLLALVEGETLAGPGEERLARLPRSAMVRAWSADPDLARGGKAA